MSIKIDYTSRTRRIGLIVPSSNTNLEPDFALLGPVGVTVHVARSGGYDVNAIPDSAEMQKFARHSLEQNLTDLKDARVDIIALWVQGFFVDGQLFENHRQYALNA